MRTLEPFRAVLCYVERRHPNVFYRLCLSVGFLLFVVMPTYWAWEILRWLTGW